MNRRNKFLWRREKSEETLNDLTAAKDQWGLGRYFPTFGYVSDASWFTIPEAIQNIHQNGVSFKRTLLSKTTSEKKESKGEER